MSNTNNNSGTVNPIAAEQYTLWEAKEQDWYATWNPCECTSHLERLAGCIASLFYSISVGGKPRYSLIDSLKCEYREELSFFEEHHTSDTECYAK